MRCIAIMHDCPFPAINDDYSKNYCSIITRYCMLLQIIKIYYIFIHFITSY